MLLLRLEVGSTCVSYACMSGNFSLVKLLIQQYKLYPLAVDKFGKLITAFFISKWSYSYYGMDC